MKRTHNTNHDGLLSAPVIFIPRPGHKTPVLGLPKVLPHEASDEAVHHNTHAGKQMLRTVNRHATGVRAPPLKKEEKG